MRTALCVGPHRAWAFLVSPKDENDLSAKRGFLFEYNTRDIHKACSNVLFRYEISE